MKLSSFQQLARDKLVLPCLIFFFCIARLHAQFNYSDNGNGTVTITGYTGPGGAVTIPGAINGEPVTSIGWEVFGGDIFHPNTTITSVTIPNSVTLIEAEAFWYDTSLTSVTIPNSVILIGEAAFASCSSLNNITIPNSVTTIEQVAFAYCSSLTNITIPNTITFMGQGVFSDCTSLVSIIIPSGVTSLWEDEFARCYSLTSVTIPASVNSIAAEAFVGCRNLTSAYFLGNIPISFDQRVFYGTASNFTIYSNSSSAGFTTPTWREYNAYVYSPNLTYTDNGTFITVTGYAGSDRAITIPGIINGKSVTSIGNSAFSGLTGLTSVTIAGSVTAIGNSAFSRCTNLAGVYFQGNAPASFGTQVFANTAPNFTVYYPFNNATGFTSPSWQGYPSATYNFVSSISIPTLPLWALVSLTALIFLGAKVTLTKKYRAI